jgi:FkbM family methyltransferase
MIRSKTSDVFVYQAIIAGKEYEFETLTPPDVIVDAGANIGLATIYFANKWPDATIIAIEPEESNYEMLVRNTKNYPNVKTIKAALFHKCGNIDVLDVGHNKFGFMTETSNNYGSITGEVVKVGTVNSIDIDKIIKDYGLRDIDILKIDIEGAEREVFSDASGWVYKVKSIITELHEGMKAGCNRSFYCNTNGFDDEWQKGEDIYLVRGNYIQKNV